MSIHLMTQRDQPYGSMRKCCEICGVMPKEYTDEPEVYEEIKRTGEFEGVKYKACGSDDLTDPDQ